jgi:hypothetical protein
MTRQETFNEVVGHMRTMGTPCKTLEGDNWVGKYYKSNGEPGCAVGVLIPPSKYKAEMENTPACKGLVEVVLKEEGHDPFLCYFLQMIHDCHPTEYWEANLKHLAMKLGLDYFPPTMVSRKYIECQIKDIWPGVDNHLSAADLDVGEYGRAALIALKLQIKSEKLLATAQKMRDETQKAVDLIPTQGILV